ncbi:MAG TPA: c-type cytochrome biogenesis protein CcsB [Nitrospirae bacterium]|nr:c-type cytochrome biogenesis protein CcsB [Nitrospirota bacterium]HDZ88710.1 c-type cytochrome biogenesis protein CcsB [Nitrospirota bacterium]
MIVYITYLVVKIEGIGKFATSITVLSFVSQTIAFMLRWVEAVQAGSRSLWRPPISDLYESIIFFVWCLILGYLIIEFKYKNRSLGAFVTPIAGLALAFIEMSGMSKSIEPLVPALQSNWLLAHVTMSFVAYSTFALSFATGLMYLIVNTGKKTEPAYIFWTVTLSILVVLLVAMGIDFLSFRVMASSQQEFIKSYLLKASFANPSTGIAVLSWVIAIGFTLIVWNYGYALKKILLSFNLTPGILDEITYKAIAIGFPVFTLGGLIFGAIWADQAWGVYWSWDPKETWTLITWFCYAFYLHARFMRGWRGNKVAIAAVLGFVAVIFTYLGVNLLLSGLHSYGEM